MDGTTSLGIGSTSALQPARFHCETPSSCCLRYPGRQPLCATGHRRWPTPHSAAAAFRDIAWARDQSTCHSLGSRLLVGQGHGGSTLGAGHGVQRTGASTLHLWDPVSAPVVRPCGRSAAPPWFFEESLLGRQGGLAPRVRVFDGHAVTIGQPLGFCISHLTGSRWRPRRMRCGLVRR